MAAKIIAFTIVVLSNLGGGVIWYFMLALGLNGFLGSDADYSMTLFPVGAVIVSLLAATAAFWATGYLIANKNWNAVAAVAVSSIVFTIVGAAVNFALMIAAVFLADFIRTSHVKSK